MNPLWHLATQSQINSILRSPGGAYIFHGPLGVGKSITAKWIAKRLNCKSGGEDSCGVCNSIEKGIFADFITVEPGEKKKILIEQIHSLQQTLSMNKYSSGGVRVVLIDAPGGLTTEAQNSLLKSIEEPPENTLIILATNQFDSLLPTVVSRCQSVFFAVPTAVALKKYLPTATDEIIALSEAIPGLAVQMTQDNDLLQEYRQAGELASKVLAMDRFERMVFAATLAKQETGLKPFLQGITRLIQESARRAETSASSRLEAVERFYRHLAANVNLKVALERLMLDI